MRNDPIWATVTAALWMAEFILIFAYALAGLWVS